MPRFEDIQYEIQMMLELTEGELSPEQLEKLDAYLDELGEQESEKIDRFAGFVRAQAARAAAMREEAQRLYRKAQAAEQAISHLKGSYLRIFERYGLKQVKGMIYSASVRKSDSVEITSPEAVLDAGFAYEEVNIVPRKTEIREAMKNGQDVPGARLVTRFSLVLR